MNADTMFGQRKGGKLLDLSGEAKPEPGTEDTDGVAAAERLETILWVRGQIGAAIPIAGTPGERYLVDHRGLKGSTWPASIRWSEHYQWRPRATPRPCLLATVTDQSGDVVAVQSVEIDPVTGEKSRRTNRPKMSRGPVGEGAVYLGSTAESPPALVIGEGFETTLTRRLVGPCDGYACLGAVRFIEPKFYHKRVEILADTNARVRCRQLAREYINRGLSTYVVTVPDSLGLKADLNDALRELGSTAVLTAVEDAEHFTTAGEPRVSSFDLRIGSDVEIAHKIVERLEELYGPVIVCESRVWRFDQTHWAALDDDHLVRFVHRADGAVYVNANGKSQVVRLNKSRIASILDAAIKYRHQPDYFKSPPRGINCESGFIRVGDNGVPELMPHARKWRQRHVVRGHWPPAGNPAAWECSLLAKYLRDAVVGDADAPDKINLLGEIAGCTALGWGTRLRNPKAIVTFSEEGATGKSTFLKLLRSLPNPEAVASVPPGKFSDEKYTWRLIGKVLNAADELPDRAVRADVFKRLITGEPVPARDVYRSATDFVPMALHVFSTNVLPSFSGGVDGGVVRRLLPLEFTHIVPENERDPDLPEHILRDESNLLLHFAVEGACRLICQRDFTLPASSQELLQRWARAVDPVRGWVAARLEVTSDEHIVAVSALFADFVGWAERHGLKREFLPSVISFGKRLRAAAPGLEYQRSDGSLCRNARLRSGLDHG